ncbi:hypothetical protein Pvag_1659 [Pantoea vagans C9-1]|nr:hypothetical protein Pvag_1659 [Pantoea vagans C9-1]
MPRMAICVFAQGVCFLSQLFYSLIKGCESGLFIIT